jgi:hypothetical protein
MLPFAVKPDEHARYNLIATCVVACIIFSVGDRSTEDSAETVLLQVKADVSHRSNQVRSVPASADPHACHKDLCSDKLDPYGGMELFDVVMQKWDWLAAYCKLDNTLERKMYNSACLFKSCLREGNLVKGASEYIAANPWNGDEAEYCFREHCSNTEFDVRSTGLPQAQAYCDKKFGVRWRNLLAGPDGLGWPGEQPGSGMWECAHGKYHCDWAYCKVSYCTKPELLLKYRQQNQQRQTMLWNQADKGTATLWNMPGGPQMADIFPFW